MSVRDIIRDLMTGLYKSDLDYINTKFSFRTVFYRSSFSCCCCTCAFEHEYLDYLSEEGQINEEMYAKIVKSIENAVCPHVPQATPDKVRETGINAIHIAAAVGTKAALVRHIDNYKKIKEEIFQLEPYMIAAMKNNHQSLGLYCEGFNKIYHPTGVTGLKFLHASRSETLSCKIKIKMTSLLEFCVQKSNLDLLKSVLRPHITHFYMQRVYCQVYQKNLVTMRDELLDYDKNSLNFRLHAGESFDAPALIEPAILCNEPDILIRGLKYTDPNCLNPLIRSMYAADCYVLERTECWDILCKQNIVEPTYEMSVPNRISHLLYLMHFYKELRVELKNVLRNLPNVRLAVNLLVNDGDDLLPALTFCDSFTVVHRRNLPTH